MDMSVVALDPVWIKRHSGDLNATCHSALSRLIKAGLIQEARINRSNVNDVHGAYVLHGRAHSTLPPLLHMVVLAAPASG